MHVSETNYTTKAKNQVSTMNMNRRELLKAGAITGLSLALSTAGSNIFKRRLLAAPNFSDKKFVFVYLRGGNDGVNTVIPAGDPEYNDTNRPTLFLQNAIDSGNGFAQLHPSFAPLMDIYNSTAINGLPGEGKVAFLHRVGSASPNQSHFDEQDKGDKGQLNLPDGVLYRQIARTLDPTNNHFVAASLSSSLILALKGAIPLPSFSDPANFKFSGAASKVNKFVGTLPSSPGGTNGKGLLGFYGGPTLPPAGPYQSTVQLTGNALIQAMETVQDAVAQGAYTPANGATYPAGSLGTKFRNASMLFKRTDAKFLALNDGGYDTHSGQLGPHSNLIYNLAMALSAFYKDQGPESMANTVVLVTTEFGRTSVENASFGTDHAYAWASIVMGAGVKGGVYNCDSSTWSAGDLFSQSGRYVRRRTNFLAVYAEIFQKHFGDSMELINEVIPGYSALAAAAPSEYAFLNFMS